MISSLVTAEETKQSVALAAVSPLGAGFERRLHILPWIFAFALGLIHAWNGRYEISPDGISYLDMGDAYLRGDWQMAINGYWSPLYSWLLGVAMLVIKPSPYWEFPVVHLVNFIVYLGALLCFAFFLNEVIRYQRGAADKVGGGEWVGLPEWAWVVLGYTLFMWSSLELITLRYVTPDQCVAAFVYLAAGLIVRIRRGVNGWLTFVMLGGVLGFGYLAKAAMFPLAFVFLVVSLFAMGDLKRAISRVAVAAAVFLLVSSPLLITLSWSKGRVTFSDTGRLAYAWYVTDIPGIYWQGEPEWSGTPKHPIRRVMDAPEVYEFGTPVGGTYPPWYDPSYWNEGLTPRFDLRRQIEVITSGLKFHFYFLFPLALRGSIAIGLFVLLYMTGRGWRILKDVAASWFMLMPAVAAFAMYSLVHVEERFIGSFVVLLFVGLFSAVRLADWQRARRLVACVMIIIVVMFGLTVGLSSARAAYVSMRELIKDSPNLNVQVADGLKELGAQRGDKVVVLNTSIGLPGYLGNIRSSDNMRWARLAGLQIVAEVYSREDKNNFWKVDDAARRRVIVAFTQAGAKMIVDDEVPDWAVAEGWQRVGITRHYAHFLP